MKGIIFDDFELDAYYLNKLSSSSLGGFGSHRDPKGLTRTAPRAVGKTTKDDIEEQEITEDDDEEQEEKKEPIVEKKKISKRIKLSEPIIIDPWKNN